METSAVSSMKSEKRPGTIAWRSSCGDSFTLPVFRRKNTRCRKLVFGQLRMTTVLIVLLKKAFKSSRRSGSFAICEYLFRLRSVRASSPESPNPFFSPSAFPVNWRRARRRCFPSAPGAFSRGACLSSRHCYSSPSACDRFSIWPVLSCRWASLKLRRQGLLGRDAVGRRLVRPYWGWVEAESSATAPAR